MQRYRSFARAFVIVGSLLLVGIGCGSDDKAAVQDRGVFKSTDAGATWAQKSAVLTTTGQKASLASAADIVGLYADPDDRLTLYATTRDHGVWFTYDGAESWTRSRDESMRTGIVYGLAIDPMNPCTLYATKGQKIKKSTNCGHSWTDIHEKGGKAKTNDDEYFTALDINPTRPAELYAGTKLGDVLKSTDSGASWQTVNRIANGEVRQILVNPTLNNVVYVATASKGIYRSADGGATWADVTPDKRTFKGSTTYSVGTFDRTQTDALVIATKYGLLTTKDGGTTWEGVKLVNAPGVDVIYAVAVNPKDNRVIYYGTTNTLYRSKDGGEHWETLVVPTTKPIGALLIDNDDPNVVYLGAKAPPTKK